MAILTRLQAQQLIQKPANKAAITEAYDHEERIKLHTKSVNDKDRASTYFSTFLKWVEKDIKLPTDKMAAFKGMCIFPLPTTSLCTSIRDEYKKIFSADDSYREYSLLESTFKTEFKDYIENQIKVKTYFENRGLDDLMKQHNCIYVVDAPVSQGDSLRPKPYFYKVPISSVTDIAVSKSTDNMHRISYLIFKRGAQWVVIDDISYRVFERPKDSGEVFLPEVNAESDYVLVFESFHNLGYTPACFLSVNNLYDDEDGNLIAKKNNLSDAAGDLDWLLFFKVAGRMYETYGPFPIFTIPDNHCNFEDDDHNKCQGGIVLLTNSRFPGSHYDCPVCKKNSIVGPGTIYYRSVPTYKDDARQEPAAVTITAPDIPSLDYISKKIDYLEWDIYENAVGQSDDGATKEAINEKQVQSNVEGKRNVLVDLKKNFEAAEMFIVDTIGRLMYGDYYEGSTITYGEQFLLYTADDVAIQYSTYKKIGLPVHMIDAKRKLLIQTEFKNNNYERDRAGLMNLLEPWPNYSVQEVMNYQLNLAYPEKFNLKIDFAKFISNFELRNGDIVQWGSLISLEQKINKLTQILIENVREEFKTRQEPEPATSAIPAR